MDFDFYKDPRWEAKRQSILRRDRYMCQLSARYGKHNQAEIVHHVFPLLEFPEYAFQDWNLISITRKEHNKLHDRDTEELTEYGRQLLVRIARKNNIQIPEKYQHEQPKRHRRMAHGLPISQRLV